jgi:serine/threonine-protein phosphatase 2A regulatory subunit B''
MFFIKFFSIVQIDIHSRNLFPRTIFADLYQNDPYGRVRILDLYQYTMRKMWYHHSRMGLSLYDSIGQGYLRESVKFNSLLNVYFNGKKSIRI